MVIYGKGKSKPFICVFVLTLVTCFKHGFLLSITWKRQQKISKKYTLPKFNMEPKNDGVQKESPIPGYHFQVPC